MIGSVVGNYKIIDKIGEGGMGAVFKGVDLMLEREVAIKVLRTELARQPQIVERFRAEAVTLAKLSHPNIATLHSFFRQGDDYFMVMEFVRGETLDHMIRAHGAMATERAVSLFCQALDGIDHAHRQGIIHRDIKPANMMLTENGSIKVMDFGIARVLGTARMTREGHLIGTIEYMSPEQIRGQETDARSDIYSLGILLYEMLTGRVPFSSQSEYELMRSQIEAAPPPPREFAPHISLPIEEAVMRALAKRAEARFQTAGEFRASLLNCMRAATNPLDARVVPGYAAPATRVSKPVSAPPVTGDPKETRLPSHPGVVSTGPTPSGPTPAYQPQVATGGPMVVAEPVVRASPLSKLSWKHYTAAWGLLSVLILVPVVLLAWGKKGADSVPPVGTQSNQAVPQTTPSPQPPSDSGQRIATPAGTAPIDLGDGSAGSKPGRNRNPRGEQVEPPVAGTEPPAATEPAAKERTQTAKETPPKDTAKAEEKKDEKKGSKIGGFFKKLGGMIGGDKDGKGKKKKQ